MRHRPAESEVSRHGDRCLRYSTSDDDGSRPPSEGPGEYREIPSLELTDAQAQRLLGMDCDACAVVLSTLLEQRFLGARTG